MLVVSGALTSCWRPRTTSRGRPGPPPPTAPPTTEPTAPPDELHKTIAYGPYEIPAASSSHMGMVENHIALGVERPCNDCYITGMQADLVTEDGTSVNIADGLWLHHVVMHDFSKRDLTCAGTSLGVLGQRFFSSGNERSPVKSLGRYGYAQPGTSGVWNLVYDLMNMTAQARTVKVAITYDYVPISTPGYRAMTPIWLDINQCGNSEQPAQEGAYSYNYSLTSEWSGKLIGIGGHIHDGGTNLTIARNGQVFCDSKATYGGSPSYIEHGNSLNMPGLGHIARMSRCQGTAENPVTTIVPGDTIDLVAYYDSNAHTQMAHPVMGIAIGYFDLG
jgi:hypothetical protein